MNLKRFNTVESNIAPEKQVRQVLEKKNRNRAAKYLVHLPQMSLNRFLTDCHKICEFGCESNAL